MSFSITDIPGLKVTIMGLGLHGGGLASALFFARHGAAVTVTDLRSADILKPTLEKLRAFTISYTLGRHEIKDFTEADIVIKNPAVPAESPFLQAAKRIETDISVFLSLNKYPVIAVTGSKGKSTTVSALYDGMKEIFPLTKLGGNITVSPLTFIDSCMKPSTDPVILELSSWQLADIKGKNLLHPETAIITNIMPDHQNRYRNMDAYVADKKLIYTDMQERDALLCNYDDPYGKIFAAETKSSVLFISAYPLPADIDGLYLKNGEGFIQVKGKKEKILPSHTRLLGPHNKLNLLFAAGAMINRGLDSRFISRTLANFRGIPHRMEEVAVVHGTTWYNDSAATIPQATIAAIKSIPSPFRLICGGTDKALQFEGFTEALTVPRMVYFLEGSATDRMIPLLKKENIPYRGPFKDLETAVTYAHEDSSPGESVLFSPGATSFGMFLNEFDRGDKFRDIVKNLFQKVAQ